MIKLSQTLLVLFGFFIFSVSSCSININQPEGGGEIPEQNEEETEEPEPTPELPPTCEEVELLLDDALTAKDCVNGSTYLDQIIEGDCNSGDPMTMITQILQFEGIGCSINCLQRAELAYIYIETGQFMNAAVQLNILAADAACTEVCTEAMAEWMARGGWPLAPCS